jgi:hypothetical protein
MLKTILVATFVCSSFVLPIRAEDETPKQKDRRNLTEEQKTLMKELRDKYDTNKDGKLDAAERKAMSAEDKEKLNKAGLAPRKKGKEAK